MSTPGVARGGFFFSLAFALLASAAMIVALNLTMPWVMILMVLMATVFLAPVLVWARANLTFFFLCGFVFAIPIELTKAFVLAEFRNGMLLEYVSFADVFAFLTVASWLGGVLFSRSGRIAVDGLVWPYLGLVGWSLATLIVAENPVYGLNYASPFVKWLAIFIAASNILDSKKRIKAALFVLVLGVLFQCGYALVQTGLRAELGMQGVKTTMMGRYLEFGTGHKQLLRSTGTTTHPNILAFYLVGCTPLFLSIALVRDTKWSERTVFLSMVVVAMIGLVLTYTRAGWISFAAALAAICFFAVRRHWIDPRVVPRVFAAAAVLVLLLFPYWQPVLWRLTKPDDQSANSRLFMTQQALMIIADRPFSGIGLGGYQEANKLYVPEGKAALSAALAEEMRGAIVHNRYLGVCAETGVPGLLFLLWLLISLLRRAYANLAARDEYLGRLSLGLLGAVTGMCVFFAFDHCMDITRNQVFWLIAALVVAIRRLRDSEGSVA